MSAHRSVHHYRLAAIGAAASVALAACSSNSDTPQPRASDRGSPTAGSVGASTPAPAAGQGCDTTPAAQVTAALRAYPQVTSVEVDGGCHQVSVRTTMPPADPMTPTSTTAVAICRAAAKVAYGDRDISSITVAWADGHEAAAGLRNSDCIPG